MRILVVMDWDQETGVCQADTYAHHFLDGVRVTGAHPDATLRLLAKKWTQADMHHATVQAVDETVDE